MDTHTKWKRTNKENYRIFPSFSNFLRERSMPGDERSSFCGVFFVVKKAFRIELDWK